MGFEPGRGFEPGSGQLGADHGYQCWELQITPEREKRFLQLGDNNIDPKFGQSNKLVLDHHNMLLKIRIDKLNFFILK